MPSLEAPSEEVAAWLLDIPAEELEKARKELEKLQVEADRVQRAPLDDHSVYCPDCLRNGVKSGVAMTSQVQSRSADEPMSLQTIFKCGHTHTRHF